MKIITFQHNCNRSKSNINNVHERHKSKIKHQLDFLLQVINVIVSENAVTY